ncbi:ferrochelatase [Pendulispora albinea]|uniref:Ferrochelatase n=1 Tax=Pendulispora albinea TaxID=2741071 RepID=A0ABZ2M2D6_9BACT
MSGVGDPRDPRDERDQRDPRDERDSRGKRTAAILFSHGTVERLDELPAFVTNIRRGHAPPPEVVEELVRRYTAIGGRSPLGDITRELAKKVEAAVGLPTRMAMRMWHPYPEEVLAELVEDGIERVLVVPLAQHSTPAYAQAMQRAAEKLQKPLEIRCASNWGTSPSLTAAFAASIGEALAQLPEPTRAATVLVMTAHSVPTSVLRAGDPYERDVRASAEAIAATLASSAPNAAGAPASSGQAIPHLVAFQSQGMGGGEWLGPDLPSTLDAIAARGHRHVLFAPIGFLSDHVEVLYDLDIEAAEWARTRGLTTSRAASLNASPAFVETLAAIITELGR